MHTMDHHLSNGDAVAVELRTSMVGDARVPETSYDLRATKQLPFNVVYCSDQDEDYPATELNNGVLNRGWQSSRFCYYPQEIVLELQWPSRIINMQLLSHEFKIPTKVEVFVSLIVPYVREAIGQMKRLGYLALDCNERSGHQARELKCIYIDSPATVVRLVFHNCHCNDYNTYGQVNPSMSNNGHFSLNLESKTFCKPPEVKMQGSSRTNPERICDVDLSIANRILQLQEEKNSAVLDEDYDEAKRLKGLIDRLKAIVEEIKQLENKKQLAVENEDYDTAKSCKKEIEKLRLQEQLADNSGQAEKRDEISDCGASSEESVDELAHAAEGSSQSEVPGLEDPSGTNCGDSERKEFGTQTLHPVKSTVVKKIDKEISCKTPDLRLPPKHHPFIPAMTAPNMLPNTRDDVDMHVLPTVSYKSGSSALLPVVTHSNGLHPLFNQNASTMMGMTMNNHRSKQLPSALQHPLAVLKSLPNFDHNQNGQSPSSLVINTLCQNNKSSFPTLNMKNINFLPPMIHVPFRKQMSPVKNEKTKQHAYVDIDQLSFVQDGMIKTNEDQTRMQTSNNQQNIMSWFGALVKEYNEAKNVVEQLPRIQNNDQEALYTQVGVLEKKFDEVKNLGVIQSNEKKMKFQNNDNLQAIKDQDYNEKMMNDGYNNDIMTNGKNNEYYDQKMDFENNKKMLEVLDVGQEKTLNTQIDDKIVQNSNHEKAQNFQNNDEMIELQNNGMKKFHNNKQVQSANNNCFEQQETIPNNSSGQVRRIHNNEQMSITQNNNHDPLKICQNIHELSKISRNGTNEGQFLNNIDRDEVKTKAFDTFSPLNSLNNLRGLTQKELNFQKEKELFAQMEKIYQLKIKMDASDIEVNTKSTEDSESFYKTTKESYEDEIGVKKKIDIFNNDEEVIKVCNTNIQNQRNNSFQNHGEHESNNHERSYSTQLSMSNNNNFDFNPTSNHLASSKHQSWSLQKNREDVESPQKPQVQKIVLRKVQSNGTSSPKKAHLSIKERISQVAKQAIDDLVPEPLTEYQMLESATLLKLIDMYYVQCLYSKEWKLRDKALQYLVQKMKNEQKLGDDLDTFRMMNKAIIKGLQDKVSNVFNIALELSRVIILKYASEVPASDLRNSVNDLVNILFEKLGDSNPRTKEAATKALIFLATKKEIGLPIIANPLLKPPKNQTIWRPILGRLQLVLLAIPTFGLQPPNKLGLQTDLLMAFVDQAFNNANGEVRNIAVKITIEVYRLMGSPVEKYLKNVKPVIREVLIKNFEKVSQEAQLGQGYLNLKDESFSDIPTPPIRCAPKMMEISYDERCVGPSKNNCKNVAVGKTAMDNPSKNDLTYTEEDLRASISENKDQNNFQSEASHVNRPNKKPTKVLRKPQPVVLNEERLDSVLNGHEKQKISEIMEY